MKGTVSTSTIKPWPALWSLVIGFFMILIDTTIVSVANPAIMRGLDAGVDRVLWVTSAYLLAYAVPLLVTGRLGDRFGPKRVYLIGLVVFTVASALCGFSGSIEMLIVARVLQGLGASLMTPQTMAVITRTFPPDRRGAAMGLWGATAGVATLVGPLLGGVLVDAFGWEWIFFVNVPVGIIGFVLAARFVPTLQIQSHSFDILGVVLSAVGLFLIVFGIQEGASYDWGVIVGPISVWGLIIAGVVVLVGFVAWQAINPKEPLVPLSLFRDRNFSVANLGITTMGFAVTSMSLPLIFFYQQVLGMSPTQSALMTMPMALASGGLAPLVGRLTDRMNPRTFAATGLALFATAMVLFWVLIHPGQNIVLLLLPSLLLGIANSCIWGPLSQSATRNLPPAQAGAGSGVYNTTRQFGAVLGSASIAALMQSRITAELPAGAGASGAATELSGQVLPAFLHDGFAAAMGQSMLLPGAVALLGAIVVSFMERPTPVARPAAASTPAE
ncbi:Multidrug resistance protein B [Mycetocola reblochoni REB411]|uniref:Multidrug resistance protein B n=1 Tax=Mycetocola reblochoni REB411 TaxID=1255698 RepID=A0A1R4IFC5_9MICO|nr:Multidrug resistance protein B [Mycetocola reblochoni REB411]